jgi:COP9 signalosome complex subunit 7
MANLVSDALDSQGVYSFVELLSLPNVTNLKDTEFSSTYRILEVFSAGTLADLNELKAGLTKQQLTKIKHLTLVSLSLQQRVLPYDLLLKELEMENVRELEDLIIDAIYQVLLTYAGSSQGKAGPETSVCGCRVEHWAGYIKS